MSPCYQRHELAPGIHADIPHEHEGVPVKTMAEVLVKHQRQNSHSCLCGWAKLGHSHPEHQASELTAAGFGLVAEFTNRQMQLAALMAYDAVEEGALREAGAKALEDAADEADGIIAAGDIAECAAPVDGESGRYEAVAARDSLYENGPGEWLRARAAAMRGEG